MTRTIRPQDLIDSTVLDPRGNKIGKVGNVYLSDGNRQPEWVTVKTGMFGHKESFVPLTGANMDEDGLHVKVEKEQVSDAPRIDAEGHLSQQESMELYRYYQLPTQRSGEQNLAGEQSRSGEQTRTEQGNAMGGNQPGVAPTAQSRSGQLPQPSGQRKEAQAADARQDADSRNEAMIRSEERLKVGTEQVETGHVRLHKYVVTEEQQITVPVSHEEVRVERRPITDQNARGGKPEIGEAEQDVVLHAEKPVVTKETVPVEEVRLGTEQITEDQNVTGTVRKEQIEVEDDSRNKKR